MKLLLINQAYSPDVAATGQLLTDLSIYLAKSGHAVTVLTARRGYTAPHPIYPAKEIFEGVRVVRVWPFHFGRKIRLLRILDALFLNLAFAVRILLLGKFDLAVSMTSPPLVACVALFAARFYRSKFAVWFMDLNPDEAIEAGWIKKNSLQAKILDKALHLVLKKCDACIVLDHYMKDRLVIKGADHEKIFLIPPWTSSNLKPIAHLENPFRKNILRSVIASEAKQSGSEIASSRLKTGRLMDSYQVPAQVRRPSSATPPRNDKLAEKFIVMYSGNHSICHPLDTLLMAALELKENPSIVFLFVGGGDRVQEVLDFKAKHQISNILYLPYQKKEGLSYSLSAADLHVVVMGESYVGIVHPSKIYGILETGRPFVLIGPENSPIGELITQEEAGFRVSHGAGSQLAEIILSVQKLNEMEKEKIASKERKIAGDFSSNILCRKMENILKSIVNVGAIHELPLPKTTP